KYVITGRGQKFELQPIGTGFKPKPAQAPEIPELEQCLRWFQDNQISKVIGYLQSSNFKKVAAQLTPLGGQPAVIRAISPSETYSITLDPDTRPIEISLASNGLNRGHIIRYSDYQMQRNAYYPKHMEVIQPEEVRHGVVVQLDNVELGLPEKGKPKRG